MITKQQRHASIEGLEGRVLFDASQLTETVIASTLPTAVSDQATLKGTVTVQVSNNSGVAQKFKGKLAIDATQENVVTFPLSNGTVLRSIPVSISLASGATKTFKVPISVGKGKLTDGTDTLLGVLSDATNAYSQTPPIGSLVVHAPIVALSETETLIKFPASAQIGIPLKAADHVTITNGGTDPFSGSLIISLVAAPNDTVTGSTAISTITKKLTLNPGHHVTVGINIRTLVELAGGTYDMISAVTQPNGTVTSSDPLTAPVFTIVTTPLFVDTINSASEQYATDTNPTTAQHITQLDVQMSIQNNGLNSLGVDTFTLFASTKPTLDSTAIKENSLPLTLDVYTLSNYPLQVDFSIPDNGPDNGTPINYYIFVQVTDTAGDVTQASYATPISFAGPAGG
jgi:hypothetical protein